MTTAPAELTYGYVDGRFILIVGDTSDAGRMPDPVPATDTAVQITPKQPLIRVTGADPTTVVKQPITCTLDKDGRLLDPEGERGVWLVTGAYTVTYRSPKATIPSHDIEVTAEHTESSPLYLTRAIPPGGPVLTPTQYAELSARIDALGTGGGGGGTGLTEDPEHPGLYLFSTGGAPIQVTANVPTADDDANLITWTPKTGVEYVIGGTVRTPPYSVGSAAATVTVEARAQAGYTLTGTTSWTFTFTQAPTTPATAYADAVMADAPVAFYMLDEPAGTTPVDKTGTTTATNNGVTLGSQSIIAGATSALATTTATGANYIAIGQPAAFASATVATIEFIMKGSGRGGIVNKSNADTQKGGAITYIDDGTFRVFEAPSGAWTSTVGKVGLNETAHIAIVLDGTNVTLYKNGAQVETAAYVGKFGGGTLGIEIGRQDQYDGGRISSFSPLTGVALHNKVLTPARILAHAQAAGLAT